MRPSIERRVTSRNENQCVYVCLSTWSLPTWPPGGGQRLALRVVALRGGVAHDRSSSSSSTSSLARRSLRCWPPFPPFRDHRASKYPHRSPMDPMDRSEESLEVYPRRTVFDDGWTEVETEKEGERKKDREKEREINKGREREKEKERVRLDIARGSVQYWRTSSWPTTVATPASLGFLLSSYLCLSLAFVPPRTGALPKFHEIHVDVVKKTCLSARLSLILRPGWLKFNFVSIVVVWGYVSELGRWRLERTVADTSCGIRELKRKQCCLLKIVLPFVWINFLLQVYVESTVYLLLQNEKFIRRIEWVVDEDEDYNSSRSIFY